MSIDKYHISNFTRRHTSLCLPKEEIEARFTSEPLYMGGGRTSVNPWEIKTEDGGQIAVVRQDKECDAWLMLNAYGLYRALTVRVDATNYERYIKSQFDFTADIYAIEKRYPFLEKRYPFCVDGSHFRHRAYELQRYADTLSADALAKARGEAPPTSEAAS